MNRQCEACRPGVRCNSCRERGRAHLRMYRLCRLEGPDRHRYPVEYANQITSMNDARAALCIAMGIPLDLIHPCTGHDLSTTARRTTAPEQLEMFASAS
jgi:hypothetical protein